MYDSVCYYIYYITYTYTHIHLKKPSHKSDPSSLCRTIMKKVFDDTYKQQFIDAELIPSGKLQHLISDAATMQIIRWTKGGFGRQ